MASTNKYLDYAGLSEYDRLLKDYLNKKYSNKYTTEEEVENIVSGEGEYDGESIVQAKTLSKYEEILKDRLKVTVVDSKPMVKIDEETTKEIATKDYVDTRLSWVETF